MNNQIKQAIKATYNNEAFWTTLLDESMAQAGPFDGNCLNCAKALIDAFGEGQLVRIASNLNNGQTEHYGALIDSVIYDFDGPAESPDDWIARFIKNESINDRQCYYAEDYDADTPTPDDPATVKAISKIIVKLK